MREQGGAVRKIPINKGQMSLRIGLKALLQTFKAPSPSLSILFVSFPLYSPHSTKLDFTFSEPEPEPNMFGSAQPASKPPQSTIKFLCSYGGRILPRYPDGKLRYLGGHTRVLAVDRFIPFSGQFSLSLT